MASSKKSAWNSVVSGNFSEDDKFTVASVQNKSKSAWRLAGIQEICNGQNEGAGSRRGDPYLEESTMHDGQGSTTEYSRPRIRKDLLPHDLMKWTTSVTATACADRIFATHLPQEVPTLTRALSLDGPAHSSLPSEGWNTGVAVSADNGAEREHLHSQEKWREDIGAGATDVLTNSYLPDYIEQLKCWARSTNQSASSLNDMEMQGGLFAAASIDKDLYQNLVEMIPLMESFMDQRGNQRKIFSHHASLVYTPAPPRDGPTKKVPESPCKVNKIKQQKTAKVGEAKCDQPVCEQQENVLKCSERAISDEAFVQSNDKNQHSAQLQNQIEELKDKLLEKEKILQSVRTYDDAHNAVTKTNELLQSKIDELQQELRRKETLAQSIELQLSEKQHELENMNALFGRLQDDVLHKNDKAFRMKEEMDELRCQVTTLRYQLEKIDADESYMQMDPHEHLQTSGPNCLGPMMQGNELKHTEKSNGQFMDMESARRMYLAAVVAAREKPGEEALTLAAELRKQLQTFLIEPMLLCTKDDSFDPQSLGFPLF